MNSYVQKVINDVKERNPNEPEFIQAVEELLTSISPVIDQHPEYEKAGLRPARYADVDAFISAYLKSE